LTKGKSFKDEFELKKEKEAQELKEKVKLQRKSKEFSCDCRF